MSDIIVTEYKNDRLAIIGDIPKYDDTFRGIGARYNSQINAGKGGWTLAKKKQPLLENLIEINNQNEEVRANPDFKLDASRIYISQKTDIDDNSSRDIIVRAILDIINNAAIIAVVLVKKLPTDLEDTKLSCETPKPKAPPSDFWIRITTTNKIANIIFITKTKFSIATLYSNFLLYQ